MAEQGIDVTMTMGHSNNQYIIVLDAINDDVLASGKTAEAGAKIFVAGTA